MKILHVIESLDLGGAERALLDLITHRPDSNRQDIVVCLSQEGDMAVDFKKEGIPVICLYKKRGCDFKILFKLSRLLQKENPDIIHTHLFTGNLWGRLVAWIHRIPCVMSVQNYDCWITGWRVWAERLLAIVPQMTVCVSESSKNYRHHFGLKNSRACVIANSSSRKAQTEERDRALSSWQVSKNHVVVGVLARCVEQKNPQLFIEIGRKLINSFPVTFIWLGEGVLREKLSQSLFGKEKEKILFLGHTHEPMKSLSGLDIVLSTSQFEGVSLSLLEAMRSQKPVLATNVPGNREMFEKEFPELLFSPEEPNEAAEKIKSWIENPEERFRWGQELKKYVDKEYAVKTQASQYHSVYTQIYSP